LVGAGLVGVVASAGHDVDLYDGLAVGGVLAFDDEGGVWGRAEPGAASDSIEIV
jgi:hypothetical protein